MTVRRRPSARAGAVLGEVVRGGLCAGCGLCESIAGRETVAMAWSGNGQLRPRLVGQLAPAVAAEIEAVCPAFA